MKKNKKLIGFLSSLILVATFVLQLVHGVHHYNEFLADSNCHHKQSNQPQWMHKHHGHEACKVCQFGIQMDSEIVHGFDSNQKQNFEFKKTSNSVLESFSIFNGNSCSYRGPPLLA
jgi:hypothetical protein